MLLPPASEHRRPILGKPVSVARPVIAVESLRFGSAASTRSRRPLGAEAGRRASAGAGLRIGQIVQSPAEQPAQHPCASVVVGERRVSRHGPADRDLARLFGHGESQLHGTGSPDRPVHGALHVSRGRSGVSRRHGDGSTGWRRGRSFLSPAGSKRRGEQPAPRRFRDGTTSRGSSIRPPAVAASVRGRRRGPPDSPHPRRRVRTHPTNLTGHAFPAPRRLRSIGRGCRRTVLSRGARRKASHRAARMRAHRTNSARTLHEL